MDQLENVFQMVMHVNEGDDTIDSTKKAILYKDMIIRQYTGDLRNTEGRRESSAVCKECIKEVKIKFSRAENVCFRCNVYLCQTCAKNHKYHMQQSHSDIGTNQKISKQAALKQFEGVYKQLVLESDLTIAQSLSSDQISIHDRFDIRHSLDWKEDCWIRDMCILDNGFVAITDSESESIKLFDNSHELIRRIQLQTWPCGIVQIPNNCKIQDCPLESPLSSSHLQIGMTLPVRREIIILNLDSESDKGLVNKEIKVDCKEKCYWLLFHDGLFITMCQTKPPSCHFITLSGITLKVIYLYFDTIIVSDWYPRITISPKTGTMYVSSYDDNLVFCMDLCGTLLYRTTETVSKTGIDFVPYGITTDAEQNVYVCSEKENVVYKFSQDLRHSEVFVDKSLCHIDSPAVIVVSRGKFYISHDTELSDIVTVINTD